MNEVQLEIRLWSREEHAVRSTGMMEIRFLVLLYLVWVIVLLEHLLMNSPLYGV